MQWEISMTRYRNVLAFVAAAGLSAAPQLAMADMGKAPATNGVIVSFEGGYLYQSGPYVIGHGTSEDPVVTGDEIVRNVTVSPDDGYFLGGFVGFDTGTPYLLGLHRVEFAFLYGETEDSARSSV